MGAGAGPVDVGLADDSSGSSASKLRLQDLEKEEVVAIKVERTAGRVSAIFSLEDAAYLMICRMLLTVASFSGTCKPSRPERDRKPCWPL